MGCRRGRWCRGRGSVIILFIMMNDEALRCLLALLSVPDTPHYTYHVHSTRRIIEEASLNTGRWNSSEDESDHASL